jgi:cytochrome P450
VQTSELPAADALLRRALSPDSRDPYRWLARLRAAHPVHRTAAGTWVFSRHADVRAITRDPALAVKDAAWFDERVPGWRDHPGTRLFYSCLVFRNGADHRRLRTVMAAAFTPARLAPATGAARREAISRAGALAASADGAAADLRERFTVPVACAAICALIGVPRTDGRWLHALAQPFLALLDPLAGPRAADQADRAAADLLPYLAALVAGRRDRPRDDLATLVAALSDDEAASALTLALAAGFDTTATLLDTAIAALLARPAQAGAVAVSARNGTRAGEAVVNEAVVNEALRYDTPVALITRVARRGTVIGGTPIAAGEEVMALLAAAHRDPARFPGPDAFDPGRGTGPLLSFGGGPHYCLGAQLARQVAAQAIPELLGRCPGLALGPPPQGNERVTLRGYRTLPVTRTTPGTVTTRGTVTT